MGRGWRQIATCAALGLIRAEDAVSQHFLPRCTCQRQQRTAPEGPGHKSSGRPTSLRECARADSILRAACLALSSPFSAFFLQRGIAVQQQHIISLKHQERPSAATVTRWLARCHKAREP